MAWFGIASYGVAGLAYAVTTAMLIGGGLGGSRRRWLVLALGASTLWACGIAFLQPIESLVTGVVVLDVLHGLAWIACILSWLSARSVKAWLAGGALAVGAAAVLSSVAIPTEAGRAAVVYPLLLVVALIGLLAVEQVYRNREESQRKPLLLLCLATGAIFIVDLFVYSQATLLDSFLPFLADTRGVVNAALAPVILAALKRNASADRELVVSRQVAFYTASLLGVGVYLFAMAIMAYFIRRMNSDWSVVVEVVFLVVSLGVLVFVLVSANIRTRFGVFLVKHFYRHKYDYRREWLRLTQNLGRAGDLHALAANGLEGLAGIVGSSKGDLWLARESERYVWMVSLDGAEQPKPDYDPNSPIVLFLAAHGWVIDSDEYAREPDRYGTFFGAPAEQRLPPHSLIVPLDCQGYLQGFVVIEKPAVVRTLNFEDHDILKTAGRQVGVVLAQALMLEKLSETRQFEAMNRLSTFLMHDLKNIVAQQELILANAQRFRHRPEFIDDTFTTIRSGVERMKRVLEQLHAGSRREEHGPVDVSKVLMEVRSQCADREPVPRIDVSQPATWISMDRDKLASALTHLLRNAQDATPPSGEIKVTLTSGNDELVITVEDTGCGMDADFVRNRLFRPFDSTKGAKGMGIGAYQVRELVRSAGGQLDVVSGVGVGTVFTLRLPAPGVVGQALP